MKKRILLLFITIVVAGIVLSSYEHGPAYEANLNRTGSQGGLAACTGSGCHNPNTATTVVSVVVVDAAGTAVSSYTPGATYAVTISGHNTTPGIPITEFGFQVSAVLASTAQAGVFATSSATPLARVVSPVGGLEIVEHKNPIPDSVNNYAVAHFNWTAPAAGNGVVKFYGILNALTDDGDDSYPNTAPVLTLTEIGGAPAAVSNTAAVAIAPVIYPNPCADHLDIKAAPGTVISVYNIIGQRMYNGMVTSNATDVNTSLWLPGIYEVVYTQGAATGRQTIVKQ